MATSNDGISKFNSSIVYAPVEFKNEITADLLTLNTIDGVSITTDTLDANSLSADSLICPLLNGGSLPLILSSEVGLLLSGTLANQEIIVNAQYQMNDEAPYFQSITASGAGGYVIALPSIQAGQRYVFSSLVAFQLDNGGAEVAGVWSSNLAVDTIAVNANVPINVPAFATFLLWSSDGVWRIMGMANLPLA